MRTGGVVHYLHGDHLGSTSLVTDGSGGVVARRLFRPYGEERYHEGTLPTDFGFTAQREDGSTGLVFMHARYYDARLGRFVQADTIVPEPGNPQEWNRYSYCLNSPVTYVDPDGHQIRPPEYQPFAIQHTGTTGPYVSSADTQVSYNWPPPPPPVYLTAGPPRQVKSSAALIQAQKDVRTGSAILWGLGAIGAFGGTAAGGGQGDGYAGNMPPGQALLGAGPSGTGNTVLPLNTAMFRLSREGEFTAHNFRYNLAQIRPMPTGGNYDAHHMLAKTFESYPGVMQALAEAGVSIHDPRWGAWWERGPEGTHQKEWRKYNQDWMDWLKGRENLTFDQLVGQAEYLAGEYGLDWSGGLFYYDNPYTTP